MASYKFLDTEELKKDSAVEELILGYPCVGRKVEGGKGGPHAFLTHSEVLAIDPLLLGINGDFSQRSDQYTSVDSDKVFTVVIVDEQSPSETVEVQPGKSIIVSPNVRFSINFEAGQVVRVFHRYTNGIAMQPDDFPQFMLPSTFSQGTIPLRTEKDVEGQEFVVSTGEDNFTDQHGKQHNYVTFGPFAGSRVPQKIGSTVNTFTMQWKDGQILFNGTGGSLKGGQGNPGVFDVDGKQIKVNRLLKRPDSSFYVEANHPFIMVIADSEADGEPNRSTLRAVQFSKGVKLPVNTWHSVPFPPLNAGPIDLIEKIAETEANVAINVLEETGEPISVAV